MLVLDCSAAVRIAQQDEEGMMLAASIGEGEWVISPELFHSEVSNTFWKYAHVGEITAEDAMIWAHRAISLVDEYYRDAGLFSEVLHESCRLDHPAYDLYYLVLARRTGSRLLTCDQRLKAVAEEMGVACA